MDTLELTNARAARCALRWLAASLLCLGAGACADLEPREELAGDVDRLAERLVQTARERADLRQLRVWVAEIHETRPQTARTSVHDGSSDVIGQQLENELVIALATRLNVVESELVEPTLTSNTNAALGERAAARGATHVLVGDYVRQRDVVQITLRLIDAESRLIVAAARGEVHLAAVGLPGFERWARDTESHRSAQTATAAAMGAVATRTPAPAVQSAPSVPGSVTPNAKEPAPAASAAPPPAQQPPAAAALTAAPSRPIEDFETWRKREQAEREAAAGQKIETLENSARASTDGAVRARRNELANLAEESAEPFPWHHYPWLAHLLGVPDPVTGATR